MYCEISNEILTIITLLIFDPTVFNINCYLIQKWKTFQGIKPMVEI